MEDKNKNNNHKYKCSNIKHSTIDANCYCPKCDKYYCEECDKNVHSNIFGDHIVKYLNEEKEIEFIDLCNEPNHLSKFEYFCKTHNKLCCAKCITKVKDEYNGQHKDCDTPSLKDIKKEKEKKFKEDYSKLKENSININQSINLFNELKQDLSKNKKDLISNIQKVFNDARLALKQREEKLLSEVDEIYKNNFYDEKIAKESENLPFKLKESLDSIGELEEIKNKQNKLSSEINYYIKFENNMNKIEEINKTINNCNSNQIDVSFKYDFSELENTIKEFGSIKIIKDENLSIKFDTNNIVKTLDVNEARFITLDDITIINKGSNSYRSLVFFKDEQKSSKDINFFGNSENTFFELTLGGEFEPKEKSKISISLSIDNPKKNATYKLVLHVKEKKKRKNLSEPFEIVIKVKGDDPVDEEKVKELIEHLQEYYDILGVVEEEKVRDKIIELNYDEKALEAWAEDCNINGF